MKAVFPVNGLGTRFLPATKAVPKEMLPVVDKPLIQYAVEEAAAAGITEMIFVTGRTKRAIEDHFDNRPELERELEENGKKELLETLRDIVPVGVTCVYIRQPKPLGLGHAVLCARPAVGNEPFAVILADDLVDADVSVTKQLVEARERAGGGNVLAVQQVPREHTKRYGIVSASATADERRFDVSSIVEKPDPEVAPSTEAVIGRYAYSNPRSSSTSQSRSLVQAAKFSSPTLLPPLLATFIVRLTASKGGAMTAAPSKALLPRRSISPASGASALPKTDRVGRKQLR